MAEDEKIELTPASENIWYALATIAGEAESGDDPVHEKNCYYWNGIMRLRLPDDKCAKLKDKDGEQIVLPELTKDELSHIREQLDASGFDWQYTRDRIYSIDFSKVKMPISTNFSKFIFAGYVYFKNVVFTGPADFNNANFTGDSDFSNAAFMNYVDFEDAMFARSADFDCATFNGIAGFRNATFARNASFRYTAFKSIADFRGAKIEHAAGFTDVTFTFHVLFSDAAFTGHTDFSSSVFKTMTDFTRAKFRNHPPEFFDASISESIKWEGAEFPAAPKIGHYTSKSHKGAVVAHKNAYERLSLMMSKLEKTHDKHMFFRHEMRARREHDTGWKIFPAKAMNWLYDKSCDYGYGFGRALAWWFGHIVLGGILILAFTNHSWANFVNSFATSFSNAHSFLGLNRGPLKKVYEGYAAEGWFNALWTCQALFGIMFLFFLILTIRNRFKMG